MGAKWSWALVGLAALAVLGVGGWYGIRSWTLSRLGEEFRGRSGSALLGVSAGEVVPQEGRAITEIRGQGGTLKLSAPIALYPGARIQGVALWMETETAEVELMMATEDPPSEVVEYYREAWQALRPRVRAHETIHFRDMGGDTTSHFASAGVGEDQVALVEARRGPELAIVDDARFYRCFEGKERFPLREPRREATEIWLSVPITGPSDEAAEGMG